MNKFEVFYRPEANGPIQRLRRARRTFIGLLIGLVVLAIILLGGSAIVLGALSIPLGERLPVIAMLVLYPISAMVAAIAYAIWLMSKRRTTAPPVALRLTSDGIAVWPMAGADFLLPWANVSAIQTSRQGIAILPTPDTGPDTPGAMGLTDYASRALLSKPTRFHTEGFDWQSLRPFDTSELDAATRGFSNGQVAVLRQ